MHFKIKTQQLLQALQIVDIALSSKGVIESLKGIKIEVMNDKIIFTSSKQEVSIVHTVIENFETINVGRVVVPGNYFFNIIKKTVDEYVELSIINNSVLISSNSSKIELVEIDISSYPEVRFDFENSRKISISKKLLKKSYMQTKSSISVNTAQPLLTGINFKFNKDKLIVSSTDTRRLSISKFELHSENEVEFTISKFLMSDVLKTLENVECDEINIYLTNNQLVIKSELIMLKTRLLEGKYPDVEKLVPQSSNFSFVVDASTLKLTLEKIVLLSEKDGANVIAKIENEQYVLESKFRELGQIEERCPIQILSGTPFNISYDPHFVLDAISSIQNEKLELRFTDEISPFSITKWQSDESNIQIISPLRMA